MTIDEIKELIHVVHETKIAELEVQRGDNRVRITSIFQPRNHEYQVQQGGLGQQLPVSSAQTGAEPGGSAGQGAAPSSAADEALVTVKSPIVGTYYDSPKPDAPPFVRVGDAVEPGKVLCIIESMKLMNEIEAEVAGTVVSKLVENGKPVEYGQSLFTIRPR